MLRNILVRTLSISALFCFVLSILSLGFMAHAYYEKKMEQEERVSIQKQYQSRGRLICGNEDAEFPPLMVAVVLSAVVFSYLGIPLALGTTGMVLLELKKRFD